MLRAHLIAACQGPATQPHASHTQQLLSEAHYWDLISGVPRPAPGDVPPDPNLVATLKKHPLAQQFQVVAQNPEDSPLRMRRAGSGRKLPLRAGDSDCLARASGDRRLRHSWTLCSPGPSRTRCRSSCAALGGRQVWPESNSTVAKCALAGGRCSQTNGCSQVWRCAGRSLIHGRQGGRRLVREDGSQHISPGTGSANAKHASRFGTGRSCAAWTWPEGGDDSLVSLGEARPAQQNHIKPAACTTQQRT